MLPQSHTSHRFSDARQSSFMRQLYGHEERTLVNQPPAPKAQTHLSSNYYNPSWWREPRRLKNVIMLMEWVPDSRLAARTTST